jgi:hypothetical protein
MLPLISLLNVALWLQAPEGLIKGTIFDSTGAVVPAATLTARHNESGVERTTESNGSGSYVLYPLRPGTYTLTINAKGFRTERVEALEIEVAAVTKRDFRLQVGAVEETVTVSAQGEALLVRSISVESTVTRPQIEHLPLNGRDFNQLVLLAAGTVENSYSGRDFGAVAANGNRNFSNDYQLDGSSNNNRFNGRAAANVSVDLIREFKVISGVAPAEYGQAGTQVVVVSRSGSNQWHGSAFEYHRGSALQASDPFNPGVLPPFERNQFGGSLGGPVRRNRTFFFFNYEGNRQSEAETRVSTVPPDAFWKGDFSALLARGITLRDPLATGRPVIPNNRLDLYMGGTRIVPSAPKLQPFWGSPTTTAIVNNRVANAASTANANQFTTRIDHTLPRNQNLMFRWTRALSTGENPSILGNGIGTSTPNNATNLNAGWTASLTPRLVNELRAGLISSRQNTVYQNADLPTTQSLGLRGFPAVDPGRPPMPRITFSGNDAFTQLNYGATVTNGLPASDLSARNLSLADTLTWVLGRHTLKAGFEYRRNNLNALQQSNSGGQLAFAASATSANSTGYSLADLLMGLPSTSQEVPPMPVLNWRERDFASYIQDDWRVSRRLNLTFGLRHELLQNPYEAKNRLAFFDPGSGAIVVASDDGNLPVEHFSATSVAKLTDGKGNWRFPLISDKQAGLNPRTLIDPRHKNFGPRFGFVYALGSNDKTVLRGGYGIFYTRYLYNYLQQTVALNPPFAGTFNYTQAITNGAPAITITNPYTAAGTTTIAPGGLARNFRMPSNQQWNLTLERDLGWNTVLSLGYVGNRGTHLFRSANANGPYLDATGQVKRNFSANFGNSTINMRRSEGVSLYHAMLTEVRRRARNGLLIQANWTWAKGLDNVGTSVNANALDVENLGRDRANSDYVRRHIFKVNGSYELPFGRGRAFASNLPIWADRALGGWRLSGIWTFTTGMVFTPTFTAAGGLANNRPDVVFGVQANLPRDQRTPSRWFNAAAFAPVPATDPVSGRPRFGNAGRNILTGPGINVADTSLAKSFSIFSERARLTFRMEVFNTLNRPNYGLVDANISNRNTVGTINTTVKAMRQAQFAIRLDF